MVGLGLGLDRVDPGAWTRMGCFLCFGLVRSLTHSLELAGRQDRRVLAGDWLLSARQLASQLFRCLGQGGSFSL